MKIISLLAQKGGTGKTTLALSIAVEAQQKGNTVAIVDLDPQASACNWSDRRGVDRPAVVSAHVSRLSGVIATAEQGGVDILIIDTPAKSEQASLAAAKAADLVLMPCRPQIHDLETIPATKEIVDLAGNTPALVILNAVPPQGRRHEEARAAIEDMGLPVCPVYFVQRAAFGDAPNSGQTAQEFEPTGKAAQEINMVYKYISKLVCKFESEEINAKSEPAKRFA